MPRIIPKEIEEFKQNNDWLSILRFYDMQTMSGELPNVSSDERDEILFAAKHWCDDILKRAKKSRNYRDKRTLFEQAIRGYIWTWGKLEEEVGLFPDNAFKLSSFAYTQYELYTSLKITLFKPASRAGVDKRLLSLLNGFYKESFEKAQKAYKQLRGTKNFYRYAKLLHKKYDNLQHETPENYKKLFEQIVTLYSETINSYTNSNNHLKESEKIEYIRALYNKSKFIIQPFYGAIKFDDITSGWSAFAQDKKCGIYSHDIHRIKWDIHELKSAYDLMVRYFSAQHLPIAPNNDDVIKKIAENKNLLNPVYPYYLMGKIYLCMAWVYAAPTCYGKFKDIANDIRLQKKRDFLDMAAKTIEIAIDIRQRRKEAGFNDVGGAAQHEAELLMKLYLCFPNGSAKNINPSLVKTNSRNDNFMFYFALYLLHRPEKKVKDYSPIEILKNIANNDKSKIKKKAADALSFYQKRAISKNSTKSNDYDNFENNGYYDDNGNFYPDWLGGIETEEEFWEHND